MTDIEKVVSRSQLYESGEENESDVSQDYVLPPPGFDFEIVDVEDEEPVMESDKSETKTTDITEDVELKDEEEKEEKVEFFNMFSSMGNESNLVKVNVKELIIEVNDDILKETDSNWDEFVEIRNKRPLSYYFQTDSDSTNNELISQVAVDGQTIHEWSKKFRILSNHRVIDLKKFNSRVNLYYKVKQGKTSKKNNRKSRMKRDAQIFKKERLDEWNKSLKRIEKDLLSKPVKEYTKKNPVRYTFAENGERQRCFDIPSLRSNNRSSKKAIKS